MAAADDKLTEDAALDFSQRLHSELPLRHFGEFHDLEQFKEVVKVQKNHVFKKVFDKIWPREKEEIASLFTKLIRRMDKVIAEWAKKNRQNEVQSVSFLQKWVDILCENFNEAMEHQLLLNPAMEIESFKSFISSKKLTVTNVFENIWKPGTLQMQEERKSKLGKHLQAEEEELLEKQKHHLESKSADEWKKLLGDVGSVLLERSRQFKCYVDKRQGLASKDVLRGMVEEMLEYLLSGKGSSLRGTHEDIHGKLVEILEGEVKSLGGDQKEEMAAEEVFEYAESFDEKLRAYCIDTGNGVDEAQEAQEQDPQRRVILQEILNESKKDRSSEPDNGTREEASDNFGDGEIHVDDDEVMHFEDDERKSTVAKERNGRQRQFVKGVDSSPNEVLLSKTAAVAEKTRGIHNHRQSARIKKSRKIVQAATSGGRRKKIPCDSDSSMTIANNDKDILHPISDERNVHFQNESVRPRSGFPKVSGKRQEAKTTNNDEVDDSSSKPKKPKENVSSAKATDGDKCPVRRSARSRNSSEKAGAMILNPGKTRKAVAIKTTTIKTKNGGEDFGEKDDNEKELLRSSSDAMYSSKLKGKRCPDKITLLQEDIPKYKCNVCEFRFSVSKYSSLLKYHGEFCRKKNLPFACGECGKGFFRRKNLKQHAEIHTCEKPFKCPQCPMGFKQRKNLARHILVHTGEKPYRCTECPLRFSQRCHLKGHLRAHNRGTSYLCKTCNVHFVSSKAFHNHNSAHEEKLPFVCIYCKKRYDNMPDLKRHVIIHSGERPFKCPTCTLSSTSKFNLVRHLERVHGHSGEMANKLANDQALDYLVRETSSQSCRDIPRAKINSAVVDYVIKKANLQLPDGSSKASAESTSKNE